MLPGSPCSVSTDAHPPAYQPETRSPRLLPLPHLPSTESLPGPTNESLIDLSCLYYLNNLPPTGQAPSLSSQPPCSQRALPGSSPSMAWEAVWGLALPAFATSGPAMPQRLPSAHLAKHNAFLLCSLRSQVEVEPPL